VAGAKPDPTFIDTDEYYLDDVTPSYGPITGGTRLTLSGAGFNVNFFEAGNYVYIGNDDDGWQVMTGNQWDWQFCSYTTATPLHHYCYRFSSHLCADLLHALIGVDLIPHIKSTPSIDELVAAARRAT